MAKPIFTHSGLAPRSILVYHFFDDSLTAAGYFLLTVEFYFGMVSYFFLMEKHVLLFSDRIVHAIVQL